MNQITVETENIRKAYHEGCEDVKKVLRNLFPEQIKEITKPAGRWRPDVGDNYFSLDEKGKWTFCVNHTQANARLKIGNVFKTREEAELHAERLRLIVEVNDAIDYINNITEGDGELWLIEENFETGKVDITDHTPNCFSVFKPIFGTDNAYIILHKYEEKLNELFVKNTWEGLS